MFKAFAAAFGILIAAIFIASNIAVGQTYTTYSGPEPVVHYPLDETIADIPAPGPNLLVNPGFETYTITPGVPDSWTNSGGIATQLSRETILVNDGVNALKITADGSSTNPGVRQTFSSLTPGDAYQFQGYGRSDSVDGATSVPLLILRDDTLAYDRISHGINTIDTNYHWDGLGFIASANTFSTGARLNSPAVGRVGYWDTLALQKTVIVSDTFNLANGALAGNNLATVVEKPGVIGNSFLFDGMGSSVDIDGRASNIKHTGDFTMSAWIKPTSFPQILGNSDPRILDKQNGYALLLTDDLGNSRASALFRGLTPSSIIFSEPIATNEWSFIAGTWDGTQICILVNAVAQCSPATGTLSISNNNQDSLSIGNLRGNQRPFAGYIDDIKLYNAALTQEQVYNLYHNVVPVTNTTFLLIIPAILAIALIIPFIATIKKEGK